MTRLGWFLLRGYLGLFALLAPHRAHARREHAVIEFSIRESYEEHLARGAGRRRAVAATVADHLEELSPVALVRKTRADAAYAPLDGRHGARWMDAVPFAAGGLLILATLNSIDASSNPSYWPLVAILPAVAGTAVMASLVGAIRRGAPRILVVAVGLLGLWPLGHALLLPMTGAHAVAVSGGMAFLLGITLGRHAYRWAVALLVLAPLVPAASRLVGDAVLDAVVETDSMRWASEVIALERIAALSVYLMVLAFALRSLSRGRVPGRSAANPDEA